MAIKVHIFVFVLFFSKTSAQITTSYLYDNANRLIEVMHGDGKQVLYTYDKVGNRESMIVLVPCQNPDLIISSVNITKYTPEKIHYTLQIKNQGNITANLGSFAFAAFNSTDGTRDGSDEFRSALFTGGSLAPNATMNISYSSGFNFNSTRYYLILIADYYTTVAECVETNNDLAKLVNPCTSNTNLTITGTHIDKLISTNGEVIIQNSTLNNVLVVGRSVTQLPNSTMENSSVAIGGCLNIPASPTATIQAEDPLNLSTISKLQFLDSKITFIVVKNQKITFSVFGDTEKKLLSTTQESQTLESGLQEIDVDTSKWIKGQKYTLHVIGSDTTEVLVVDW